MNVPIVLHLPYFHGGGAEVVVVKLANYWREEGRDVTLLVNSEEGVVRERVSSRVPVVSLGDIRTSRSFPKLVRFLRETKPPLLVSTLISANVAAGSALRVARVRSAHVALIRNYISSEIKEEGRLRSILAGRALRAVLRGADGVGCVSSSVREDVVRYAKLDEDRVEVTYNPVEPIERAPSDVPVEFGGSGGPVIASVGRISEQKNYRALIDAFAILRAKRTCRLAILGDGPLRGELEAQIERFGLAGSVMLLGYRADARRYIAAADVLALTSLYEGFPNVIAEALSAGTTTVVTDGPGGGRELLGDGEFGYMARSDDAASIASALARALDAPKDEAALRERARQFSLDRIAARYLSLFERSLAYAQTI